MILSFHNFSNITSAKLCTFTTPFVELSFCSRKPVMIESYLCHLWYTFVNDNISRCFFSFFQNFDFAYCHRGKRAKIDPK